MHCPTCDFPPPILWSMSDMEIYHQPEPISGIQARIGSIMSCVSKVPTVSDTCQLA